MTSKSLESMPNQASGQERPDFSESDVEKMMNEFQEHDAERAAKEKETEEHLKAFDRQVRAEVIEQLIEEGLGEAEAQEAEKAERAATIEKMIDEGLTEAEAAEARQQAKKEAGQKKLKLEASGAIMTAARQAASSALESNLGHALLVAESPEAVETMLVNAAVENARQALGMAEDFGKTHSDEKVRQLYANVDAGIRREVVHALRAELNSWHESAENALEKARLKKLIENIEKADGKAA